MKRLTVPSTRATRVSPGSGAACSARAVQVRSYQVPMCRRASTASAVRSTSRPVGAGSASAAPAIASQATSWKYPCPAPGSTCSTSNGRTPNPPTRIAPTTSWRINTEPSTSSSASLSGVLESSGCRASFPSDLPRDTPIRNAAAQGRQNAFAPSRSRSHALFAHLMSAFTAPPLGEIVRHGTPANPARAARYRVPCAPTRRAWTRGTECDRGVCPDTRAALLVRALRRGGDLIGSSPVWRNRWRLLAIAALVVAPWVAVGILALVR